MTVVSTEDVFLEYQRAKGRWSNPPYAVQIKYNFKTIQKRPDWKVFGAIANIINQGDRINLNYFMNGLFYANRNDIKKIHPRKFLHKDAITAYIKYVQHLNTISTAAQIDNINDSKVMLQSYMKASGLKDFAEYLNENFTIYPTFISHLQNGILNYHIMAAYSESDEVLNRLPNDLKEDIQHYLKNVELIKLRLSTIEEFTFATDQALKQLGV